MNCAGDQFFAGARLAANQNSDVGRRDFVDQVIDAAHLVARAEQIAHAARGLEFGAQPFVFAPQPQSFERVFDHQPQFVNLERFREVIVGAGFDRGDGRAFGAVRGDHHDRRRVVGCGELLQVIEAARARQVVVEQDQVGTRFCDGLPRGFDTGGFGDGVVFQRAGHPVARRFLVVNNENFRLAHRSFSPYQRLVLMALINDWIVTKDAFTLSQKRSASPSPAKRQKPGYYPTRYGATYDPDAREYTVSIDGMTLR